METEFGSEFPENSMCGECAMRDNFVSLFRRKASYKPEREWTLPDLMTAARECRFCSLVLKVVSIDYTVKDLNPESTVCSMTVEDFGFTHSGPYDPNTVKRVSRLRFDLMDKDLDSSHIDYIQPSYSEYSHRIQLLAPNTLERSRDLMLLGRPIGQAQMDKTLILDWLSRCEADHHNCRPGCWADEPDLTLRLIDVKRRCVVKAPPNCRYMALSYVWGGVEQLQLESGTFARLTKDGGISNGSQDIPKSIMDAVALVEMLGEEYLWVDALCIMQDDLGDKQQQIGKMDVIYSCAMLTIVSAAGPDANAGLPGALPGSRSVTQFTDSFNGVNMITALCPFSSALNLSTWETRGWTLQEKILSKRLLIFTRHQIFYHCNGATWFEDTILENNDSTIDVVLEEDPDEIRCRKPSLELSAFKRYLKLVNGYFSRNLKYEGDALNAFAGLLKSLSAELGDTHIWGLPKSVFDKAMLWQTINHFPDRRNLGFPSWSWAGWKGGDFAALAQRDAMPPKYDIKPVIKWYRPDDHGGHIIIKSFDSGSREKHSDNAWKLSEDAEMGELQYNKALMPPVSHLLRFWTSSANLRVGPIYPSPRGDDWYANSGKCKLYLVTTLKGTFIGAIHLNKEWMDNRADTLEFIVISRAVFEPGSGYEDAFNVMLIEWQNGVAYRVQLPYFGPFKEETWIEANPQWKLITLG